jgi:hypothetical protein
MAQRATPEWGNPDWRTWGGWGLPKTTVHGGGSWRWGNDGEEVGHEVVEEVHDAGWDPVEVAPGLVVGRRYWSAWRCKRAEGNQ